MFGTNKTKRPCIWSFCDTVTENKYYYHLGKNVTIMQCIYLTRSTRITSWSWSYGSWIFNYPCNQCLPSLELWVRIPFRWGVLDTTLCDELGTAVSSTNKTDRHDITEILLKVALNTITLTPTTRYDRVLSCIRLRNNSWKPYVYIVFTTGRALCHKVLPRAKARGKKLT